MPEASKKQKPLALKVLKILALIWAAGLIAFALAVFFMKPAKPLKTTDAIIVLTGGAHRIEYGLELFANGKARHLFITGVHANTTQREIMDLWQGDVSFPPCCIDLDRKAKSTYQNAQQARAWLETKNYTSVRLVTSNYHMIRAYLEFRHALPGIEIIPHPVPTLKIGGSKRHFHEIVFIEYHKTLLRLLGLLVSPIRPLDRDMNT